ncbi:outer membrane protein with beta-barrel domain [Mariniflexile fucanivorans]|uniref:Outer membrane protein with beta-barrel domain n=1 Tax=Mariniflexile fucanivorans TaxID=264023 RepID=A0A4R1RDS8_9FLAO|nr:porin family protein [Mariniflexile fucanivorans]TCL64021.1 outer membrane protein with beta-barrel domain [Mariniflexile fucanivorans]
MKKLFFNVLCLLAITTLSAQSDSGDFTIAPQLGLNLSNYSSSENLNNKIRTAFNAGVIAEYYFNDRWSLRSGIIYDSKGTKITQSGYDYIDKLNYIAIPLHANWHFGSNRNWFLNFGPTIGFLASAKADTPEGEFDIKDFIENSFDAGLGVGIGYKFDIADDTQLYIQYQGYNGFIDLFNEDFSVFNATSAFNLGVVFQL